MRLIRQLRETEPFNHLPEDLFKGILAGEPSISPDMAAISDLPMSAEGVEKILGGNAARLLRL